jgi:thiamine biosynthesis lipoprotein
MAGPDAGMRGMSALLVARELRAMNTDIRIVAAGRGADRRLARAAAWLPAYENRFSRFREHSELSRLNASEHPFHASPGLFQLVELAIEFARCSDGLFDPTILRQLEDAGYDRSFELLSFEPSGRAHRRSTRSSWRDVQLDPSTRTVTLSPGAGIDLGGIGKGFAVDWVAAMLGTPSLVNCGGDVFAAGRPPGEVGWRIGVSDPFAPEQDLIVLSVEDLGVATSSTMTRRWSARGGQQHHLIDPRTGEPSEADAVQVTVAAPTAVEADFHAKVALLHGTEAGMRYLNQQPAIEGLAVRRDGAMFQSANFGRYWSG